MVLLLAIFFVNYAPTTLQPPPPENLKVKEPKIPTGDG
jgi:hypothetical protein